jgi:hypothetical protein
MISSLRSQIIVARFKGKNNTNDKTDTTELTDIISTMGNKLHFNQYFSNIRMVSIIVQGNFRQLQ